MIVTGTGMEATMRELLIVIIIIPNKFKSFQDTVTSINKVGKKFINNNKDI